MLLLLQHLHVSQYLHFAPCPNSLTASSVKGAPHQNSDRLLDSVRLLFCSNYGRGERFRQPFSKRLDADKPSCLKAKGGTNVRQRGREDVLRPCPCSRAKEVLSDVLALYGWADLERCPCKGMNYGGSTPSCCAGDVHYEGALLVRKTSAGAVASTLMLHKGVIPTRITNF